MDIQKVAGQHVQRGVAGQFEPEGFRVMRVGFDRRDLVRTRGLGFNAGDGIHGRWGILRGCVERAQWKTVQQEVVRIETL